VCQAAAEGRGGVENCCRREPNKSILEQLNDEFFSVKKLFHGMLLEGIIILNII
jgi:hypothetical protein